MRCEGIWKKRGGRRRKEEEEEGERSALRQVKQGPNLEGVGKKWKMRRAYLLGLGFSFGLRDIYIYIERERDDTTGLGFRV